MENTIKEQSNVMTEFVSSNFNYSDFAKWLNLMPATLTDFNKSSCTDVSIGLTFISTLNAAFNSKHLNGLNETERLETLPYLILDQINTMTYENCKKALVFIGQAIVLEYSLTDYFVEDVEFYFTTYKNLLALNEMYGEYIFLEKQGNIAA